MRLRIIYGRAGSGKSTFCLDEIKKGLDSGEKHPLVLIVPEQFSLQAEKNLSGIDSTSGIFRAEVLSFRRMAFRVFSEVGGISRKHLAAAGKSMLLFRILDKVGDQLKMFSGSAARKGFTQTLSDAITEFKRYDISPQQLIDAAAALKDGLPLKDKLSDLSLIYEQFEELLHQNYMDADDDLVELYNKLDKSTQFDNAEIWIDEFSGFTPQEYKVITKLLRKAARVTVCLCTDCISDESGNAAPMIFAPVRKTAAKLLRMAKSEGIPVERPVSLDLMALPEGLQQKGERGSEHSRLSFANSDGTVRQYCVRFSTSEELGHLERNFYKYPCVKYKKSSGDVVLCSTSGIYSEVEEVARDIIRLCRDEGYRYRDIAVTMRNPDSYRGIVKSVFMRYNIPFFFDGKRNVDGNPLVVFILSALDIFKNNWSYEAVFRYAKTGLTGLEREELDLLENYVLANGIRGNAWTRKEDWTYPVDQSFKKDRASQVDDIRLVRINAARRRLTAPLTAFREKTKGGASAMQFCTSLFDLLCETGNDKRLEELSARFAREGRLEKADEYRQVWNITMDVFSQIVEVLGNEEMGTERFSEILAAGFEGHKLGLIPPAIDQVLAGSIERARSHDIKAMYILGANEGVLPGTKGDEGLISDMDRDSLQTFGMELAGNSASRCMEERFMVYMALATPSRYLWISFPTADRDGRALRPSRVISEVKRILPHVVEKNNAVQQQDANAPQPAALEPSFDELALQLRKRYDGEEIHDGWRYIYKWFVNNEKWHEKCLKILSALSYTNQPGKLSPDIAARLYGRPIFTSVSRMEAYTSCPFSYYIKYGLKAKERKMYRFDPVDSGTFMHSIIDSFSRLLVKKGMSWRGLDIGWCSVQISELVDDELDKMEESILKSSKRYVYLSERLKRTILKAVMLISKHISSGSFEPSGYEVEFSDDGRYPPIAVELPSGELVKMTGRIDRIDSIVNEDGTYLRIIDYKSGNKALKLADVYYGLQLQLVTYLDAVLGNESEVSGKREAAGRTDADTTDINKKADVRKSLPAGVLYFRLDDPLIRCGRDSTNEAIEKAIMKELRMKGLILADVKLIREMDSQINGDSLIIPARVNKDGTLGRSSAATADQFNVLRDYVRKLLVEIGSGIISGNVAINPYKKRTMTACTYCGFSSVCQFDTAIRDNRYRLMPEVSEDELWNSMRGEKTAVPGSIERDGTKSGISDRSGQGGATDGE